MSSPITDAAPRPSDLRRHRRIPVRDLEGRLAATIGVEVLEMSFGGLTVETRAALSPGSHYPLSLAPDAPDPLQVRIVWCRLDRNELGRFGSFDPVFRAGVELL